MHHRQRPLCKRKERATVKRIRVVVCVVLVVATLAVSAVPAAAGSKRTGMLDPGMTGLESVSIQGLKSGHSGYGDG